MDLNTFVAEQAEEDLPQTVDFGKRGSVEFRYDQSKITAHIYAQMTSGDPAQVASALAQVVDSWDLTRGEDPVPLDDVTMTMRVPVEVVSEIAKNILDVTDPVAYPDPNLLLERQRELAEAATVAAEAQATPDQKEQ